MGNLSGLFNTVNTKVGEIASDVGSTPQDWNGGIFSMLQNLSETVIVPIAAAILALVMCYELIDMIVEKNNMHDFDSSMFFRWIFKSAFAILIVTNTWNIVMGVFDATQQVVNQSAGVIIGDTSIDFDTLLPDLESRLEAMDIGPLLGLWFQTLVVGLTMNILSICIFLVTYGRMIEIYAVTALGPIPLASKEATIRQVGISIIGVTLFLLLFSIITFASTIITNIATKKREYAMFQSIGMTRKQTEKMALCESCVLAIGSLILTLILGIILGQILIKGLISAGIFYLSYTFPLALFTVYCIVVVLIILMITISAFYSLQKTPLVERLRIVD